MRKILVLATSALAMLTATAANATVTLQNLTPTIGLLTQGAFASGLNLTNNGPYSSGGTNPTAYLFDEGLNAATGEHTFLLHYDRSGNARATGRVQGSFNFVLGGADVFSSIYATTLDLAASDDLTKGVNYQRCLLCLSVGATIFRGLEPSQLPVFGDVLGISSGPGSIYTINYDFANDGATMDEVRFGFSTEAVPEPATWALMIGGFGLAGATLRRRRVVAA